MVSLAGRGAYLQTKRPLKGGRVSLLNRTVFLLGRGGRGRGPEMPNNNSSIPYTVKHPHMPDVV